MKKINLKSVSKKLNNNWMVTFTSTILGVIIGLFLTNYFNGRKQLKAKDKALYQVQLEIENNYDNLIAYQKILENKYRVIDYISTKIIPGMDIVIHKDSLVVFQEFLGESFVVNPDETIQKGADSILVKGDLILDMQSLLVISDLQTVMWNTFKKTDYLSLTQFDCIGNIETVYILFNDFNLLNTQWRDELISTRFFDNKESYLQFLNTWGRLLKKQEILMDLKNEKDHWLEGCE